MPHQDFEKYAIEKSMQGGIARKWKEIFEKKFLSNFSQNKNSVKVLDYGCGDGKYFDFFIKYFDRKNIYGAEISKIRLERARKRGFQNLVLIKEREGLPFPNDFFDFVNMDQVLEHIKCQEADFYLGELRRVLKKDGSIFIVVPNYPIKRFYDFYHSIKCLLKHGKKRSMKDDPTHVCRYSFGSLERRLKKHFSVVEIFPAGGIFHSLLKINFFSHKIFAIAREK